MHVCKTIFFIIIVQMYTNMHLTNILNSITETYETKTIQNDRTFDQPPSNTYPLTSVENKVNLM